MLDDAVFFGGRSCSLALVKRVELAVKINQTTSTFGAMGVLLITGVVLHMCLMRC